MSTEKNSVVSIHRCVKCGTYWQQWADGYWSLADEQQAPAKCCDNNPEFISQLTPAPKPIVKREPIGYAVTAFSGGDLCFVGVWRHQEVANSMAGRAKHEARKVIPVYAN
jgi:hypothetical protein